MTYRCRDVTSRPTYPAWVPDGARRYLDHTEKGVTIRALARGAGCHASTVLRQIRRVETLRDDLLVDHALRRLGQTTLGAAGDATQINQELSQMPTKQEPRQDAPDDALVGTEARRILRRLSEAGACLAVARDLPKAVVVRDTVDGRTVRTGVVDRTVAEALALKSWISCKTPGRIARYRITGTGRIALKRMLAEDGCDADGMAEDASPFATQHRDFGIREVGDGKSRQRLRYNMAESPLLGLARRKSPDGKPFLSDDLVAAGERLREDFELAQMGPRTTQNWDKFLTGGGQTGFPGDAGLGEGPAAARKRVNDALSELGPGLADVVLRCCCFLEGMEAAERRMGWSARSGKIVLRIALQRLKRHYETQGRAAQMIG